MKVFKKIMKRILISIPVLIGVVLIIFVMLRVVPGDPVTTMMGEHVNQKVIDKISREMVRLLKDAPYAAGIRQELLALRATLGSRDGSVELARLAARLLEPSESSSH